MSPSDVPTQDQGLSVDVGVCDWAAAWDLIAQAAISVDQARQKILHGPRDEE